MEQDTTPQDGQSVYSMSSSLGPSMNFTARQRWSFSSQMVSSETRLGSIGVHNGRSM